VTNSRFPLGSATQLKCLHSCGTPLTIAPRCILTLPDAGAKVNVCNRETLQGMATVRRSPSDDGLAASTPAKRTRLGK